MAPDGRPTVALRARIPFRTKLVAMGAALAMIPLALVGPLVLEEVSETLERLHRELRISIAQDVGRAVDQSLGRAEDALDGVGQVLGDPSVAPADAEALALVVIGASETLDHAGVYDADGRLEALVREPGTAAPSLPDELEAVVRDAADRDRRATGPVELDGRPRVLLVVPIVVASRTRGYVASLVAIGAVQDRVERLASGHYVDLPDSLFVLDRDRTVIAHVDRRKIGERSFADHPLLRADSASSAARAAQSAEYETSAGMMVGTIVPIPHRGWAVVSQVPRDVAYGSLGTIRTVLFATGAGAVLLALFLAVFLARRISRPISELSKFAGELAARRFESRVTIETQDELALLGQAMSTAAADLQASESRIQREIEIRSDLGRYLPADLVEKVVRREQDMELGGERRQISVLFADVVAFTPLADSLAAEKVVALLNELFTLLTEIVFRHEGTVDKFMGDCVMAIFGAPARQDDHAVRALRTAEDMIRFLEAGNAGFEARYGVSIKLAIGIHTGDAIVGNIGSSTRMEYTAIGDVVNVAARLETIARPQQILVTHETRQAAGEEFAYADLGERNLAGRRAAVHLYEVSVA